MKVGILTGGGDCPGLNAVIRAVVKSLILHHGAEVIGFEYGFEGFIEGNWRELDYRSVSGILTEGGTILGTHNRANPLNYYKEDGADVSQRCKELYDSLGLDAVVVIGGDGTMSISYELSRRGMNFVGVPKTIDNDLMSTDRTFGFDTAVSIATDAIDRLQTTGQSHNRVMILETMGRYAGWIALYAGVAGGADVILIPELPYDIDVIAEVCQSRADRQRFTIICVAEGAMPEGGEMAIREIDPDSPDPVRLGGIGNVLRRQLEQRIDQEIRTTSLGHIQRGGTPTAFDRVLSSNFGTYAASLVGRGVYGHMVAVQDNKLCSVPLEEVAHQTRTVPRDSMVVASALGVGTSFGVRDLEARVTDLPERVRLI